MRTLKTLSTQAFFYTFISLLVSGCSAEFGLRSISPNSSTPDSVAEDQDSDDPTQDPTDPTNTTQNPNNPGTGGTPTGPVVVCDPFQQMPSQNGFGVSGKLYSEQAQGDLPAANRASTSSHYIKTENEVASIFLNSIQVTPRLFSQGFPGANGNPLTVMVNSMAIPLVEWFALDLEFKVKLRAQDEKGFYQYALLSDDGATVKVQKTPGAVFHTLVDNEGIHAQRFKTSGFALNHSTGNEVYPMKLSYFQGPAYHIALMLMWRKVADTSPASMQDSLNGAQGSEHFFDTRITPPTPTTHYQALLDRGWKPLHSNNYLLPESQVNNPCAED